MKLGSGMHKMVKYGSAYGGSEPELVEGDVFRIVVNVPEFWQQAEKIPQVTPQMLAVLRAIFNVPKTREDIQVTVGIKDREHFRKAYLDSLLAQSLMERTIPDRPTSWFQKYRLTEMGIKMIRRDV